MSRRVLLAEDEPNIIESITFLLDRAGYAVSVETDGRAALNAVQENCPDVLILDVMLPSLDGYEILKQLRADPNCAELPILMLTAKGQREDRETAFEHGADLFITKPFANAEIVSAVETLMGGRSSV